MKFFCEYCGYHIDSNKDSKCPNCGAMYNKNRTYLKLLEESKQEKIDNNKRNKKVGTAVIAIFVAIPVLFIVSFVVIAIKSINSTEKIANDNIPNFLDIINSGEETKTPEEIQSEIDKLNQEISSLQETINSTQSEVDSINTELASLKAQQNQEFRNNQLSERYYLLGNEISSLQDSVWDKESSIRKNKSSIESKQSKIKALEDELNEG